MREYLTFGQLRRMRWETIERLQQQRFRLTAHYLLPYVKAYSDLFKQYNIDPKNLKRVEDWHKNGLPLLKKAAYKKRPEEFMVRMPEAQAFEHYRSFMQAQESAATISLLLKALTHPGRLKKEIKDYYYPKMPAFSGGTESGKPTPVFLTAKQKQNLQQILRIAIELIFRQVRLGENLVGMNLFPYGPHLGWHAVQTALDLGADLNLCTAAGGAIPTEKLVEMAERFQANIFAGMSDYLRNRWLQVAIRKKIKLRPQVLFINGASKMHEGERTKIEELAKQIGVVYPVVLDMFGASEFKEDILPECSPRTGFHHIAPLSNIIRTVTAEGGTKTGWITNWRFTRPEQGGYAVIWNIDGAGTLLEGYLIGDVYERISRDKCPKCHLKVERVHNISRIKETEAQLKLTGMVEAKVKGARVDLTAIRGALLNLSEVSEAQVIARKNQLTIRIVPSTSRAKAEARINNTISRLGIEVKPRIEWITLKELTEKDAFKFRGIVIEE